MKIPRNLNIDALLRYEPVVKKLEELNRKKQPVLEVGSGTNGISDYYSGKVIGMDSDFSRTKTKKNSNIKHKVGTIVKIPFDNEEIYYLVCLDTFEHINSKIREKAIKEMLRVTKKNGFIILGYPSGEKSRFFEEKINYLFKKRFKKDHPWLIEHKTNGLPEDEKIKDYFIKNGVQVKNIRVIKNTNIYLWFVYHLIFTILNGSKLHKLSEKFKLFLYNLFKVSLPPFYRTIYIIKK